MKSNLIIISAIILGLSSATTKAVPAEKKIGAPNFSLRLSGSNQIPPEPTVTTPLSPTIQQQQEGCFQKMNAALCMYCCYPCLLIRSCCDQGAE